MAVASQSYAVPGSLVCSSCGKHMRLKGSELCETFPNVRHFTFVCDCGVTTRYIAPVPRPAAEPKLS
jgi:hypothetical protein